MLAKIDTQQLDFRPRAKKPENITGHASESTATDLLHDSFPYFYLTAGFAAIFATLYITDWFWVLPHSLLVAGAVCHAFLIAVRRRNDAMTTHPSEPAARH